MKAWPPIVGVLAIAACLVGVGVRWAPAGDDDAASVTRRVSTDVAIVKGGTAGSVTPSVTTPELAKDVDVAALSQKIDLGDATKFGPADTTGLATGRGKLVEPPNDVGLRKPISVTADAGTGGGLGNALADGGTVPEGSPCTCDNECAGATNCSGAVCQFDKQNSRFECNSFPAAFGTRCDLDMDPCTLDICDGTGSATACIAAKCAGGACTPCAKECIGGQDQENACRTDRECLGGACGEKPGVTCTANPTTDPLTGADRFICSLGTLTTAADVGRCCDPAGALTPMVTDESTCLADGTRGLWRRINDPDDVSNPFCPKYSSGLAPAEDKTTDAARDVGVLLNTTRRCVLATRLPTEDDNPCEIAALDCNSLCNGGPRDGFVCASAADCTDGMTSGTCDSVASGGVTCTSWADVCPIDGVTSFVEICDDYKLSNDPSFLKLREFTFRGGVETANDDVAIDFFDTAGVRVLTSGTVNLSQKGIFDWTLQFDCNGNCQPGQNAADPPVIIPSAGRVCLRTPRFTRERVHWIQATGGADVGTNDPMLSWVDKDDNNGSIPGDHFAGNNVFIFEIDGEKIADPLFACCDASLGGQAGGMCEDRHQWECSFCEQGPFVGQQCSANRDCGGLLSQELLVCSTKHWQGPQNILEAALGIGTTCPGACGTGACCDDAVGSCTEVAEAACGAGFTYEGDGTVCEPNCCPQPTLTGVDCCEDALYCNNGTDANRNIAACGGIPICSDGTDTCRVGFLNKQIGAPCNSPGVGTCENQTPANMLPVGSPCNSGTNPAVAPVLACADGSGACLPSDALGDPCNAGASTCEAPSCQFCAGPTPSQIHSFVLPAPFSQSRCSVSGALCDVIGRLVCDDDGDLSSCLVCSDAAGSCLGLVMGDSCASGTCGPGTAGMGCKDGSGVCISNDCMGPPSEGSCDAFNPILTQVVTGFSADPFDPATVLGNEGDVCASRLGSTESGWYERVSFDKDVRAHAAWCCNEPPISPITLVLLKACTCDLIFPDPGTASFGGPSTALTICKDGNASTDWTIPAGEYMVPVVTGPTCQNTLIGCSVDGDCPTGLRCENSNFGAYQLTLAATPLVKAACCDGTTCTVETLFACNALGGVWLGEGNPGSTGAGLKTVPAVFDCSGTPCDTGACCTGPGSCESSGITGITPTACAALPGPPVYLGGTNCLEVPCPACPIGAAGCQPLLSISEVRFADDFFGLFQAEDFRPQSTSIGSICFDDTFNVGGGCGGGEPDDKWLVTFYNADGPGGIPGTIRKQYIDAPTVSKAQNPTFSTILTYGVALPTPVMTTIGECLWIEISATGNPSCLNGWMQSGASANRILTGNNFTMGRVGDRAYIPLDADVGAMVFCADSLIAQGVDPGQDGGCGDITGFACCSSGGGASACDDTVDPFDCLNANSFPLFGTTCADNPCVVPPNDLCANADPILNCVDQMSTMVIGTCSTNPDEVCDVSLGGADCFDAKTNPTVTCDPAPTAENYICDPVAGTSLFSTTDGPTSLPENNVPPDDECLGIGKDSLQADVWLTVTAPCSGTMNIFSCDFGLSGGFTSGDQVAEAFAASCPTNNANLVACNDDGCDILGANITPDLNFFAFKGTEYKIRITGIDGDAAPSAGTPGMASSASQGPYIFKTRMVCSDVLPPVAPALVAGSELPTMRYLTIDPSTNGVRPVEIKVTELSTGKFGWIDATTLDNANLVPNRAVLLPTSPGPQNWGAISEVSITGCIIQSSPPNGTAVGLSYEVTAVDGAIASPALAITTIGPWGNINGDKQPPLNVAGNTDIVDVVGGILLFSSQGTATPPGARSASGDLTGGNEPEGKLDIVDVVNEIGLFGSAATGPQPGLTPLAMCP